ncbi:probable galacturonosyltransferase 4 [Aristolochia californica]|uniref:probable galacturonosyltransferase 4 n=1 Tax=Aristolochia californica TaxID=171875 RepID=UPI0035DF6903
MISRKTVLFLLFFTVLSPIVLYTERLGTFSNSLSRTEFLEDSSTLAFGGDIGKLNALPQEISNSLKEPVGNVYLADPVNSGFISDELSSSERNPAGETSSSIEGLPLKQSAEHKARVLSAANEEDGAEKVNFIEQVTERGSEETSIGGQQTHGLQMEKKVESVETVSINEENKTKEQPQTSGIVGSQEPHRTKIEEPGGKVVIEDARVRYLRDQMIRAKVYISLGSIRSNSPLLKELRQRLREVLRAVGDALKDSDLPKNANEKMKAMDQALAKAKQVQDDCSIIIKKLRAILHSTEEQLRVHKKQAMFLTQLAAKTLPKGLHCLPLRLSTEYYMLSPSQRQFPNQEKLEDPSLYHYTLFSDNLLAAAVVVNSTIFHAKEPAKHVFHIVSDRLNYAAMRMWFLANPPRSATVQVQNIEEFTWLNASYSPVLKQLASPSMIDYYFRTHRSNSDSNLKYRNPKYLSILNHLRFYLPEIFPKLNKVLFLDDDVVVQKDLTGLWRIDLKGKVNGAVETCGESFHRFDRYLNFSNPLISKNFNPRACGWAYGMNMFDLDEWRRQKITEVYHSWQNLNHDRTLWKLGTLPPGLITFWNRTYPLDRSWHVLGLGYNPNVNLKEIEKAAVIHYNGNMKPWLEIRLPKYKDYWGKFVNYDQVYLRECNLSP